MSLSVVVVTQIGSSPASSVVIRQVEQGPAGSGPGGSGDVTGPAGSANGEMVLFSGTTGKVIERPGSLNGLVKATNGVPSAAVAGTDYALPGSYFPSGW